METYLTRFTDYLLTQSWQIALLVVVIAAVSLVLRNKSAHIRYLLWLIVLAKCLVPPLLTVPLAILPQEKPAVVFEVVGTTISEPLKLPLDPVKTAPAPMVRQRPTKFNIHEWLGAGWIMGTAVFLVFNLLKAVRTNYWLWRKRKTLSAELLSDIENLFSAHRIKSFPDVWQIDGISQPFVWDLLRGSIYLPANFLNIKKPEHQKSVLGHELSHVIRFDAAVNFLQVIAQAIFWFHPFVWWANRKIRAEREKCCDEMAVARLNASPKDYSKAILEILAAKHEQTRPVPSLAVAGPVKNIEERIKTMLRPGKKFYRRPSLIAATIVLVLAMVTVPTALVLTARAQTEAASEPEEKASKLLFEAAKAGDLAEVKRLIAQGADVNATDGADVKANYVWTALHEAAIRGHKEVAELLIEKGADVNAEDGDHFTPLYYAIWEVNKDMVSLLISKGADLNLTSEEKNTPLYYAVSGLVSGDLDIVKLLVDKGAKFDVKSRDYTAFRYAALLGRRDMVEFFISRGADTSSFHMAAFMGDLSRVKEFVEKGTEVDTKDEAGWTALFWAASAGQEEVAEFLINNNADINANDGRGQSLLYQAVQTDAVKLAELLIAKGADVNAKNNYGLTPLHLACRRGNKEMAELLISQGADVNAKIKSGHTPLNLAEMAETGIVELLIDKGADINASGLLSHTPLHRAAAQGKTNIVELLIAKGVNINPLDYLGHTPLDLAMEHGHTDVVNLLRQHGAKETLYRAITLGDIDTVKLLISQGADVNAKDKRGRTPLSIAKEKEYAGIVELLRKHGAKD